MSTHPNVILLLTLKPDDLVMKTYRDILKDNNVDDIELDQIEIHGEEYNHDVMESDYKEDIQISADKGDIIIHNLVTYGYGEKLIWHDLEKMKKYLEKWAMETCIKHKCSYKIWVGANHW